MTEGSPPLLCERLGASELEGDGAWWGIYEDSFPASEREPPGVVVGSVRRGDGLALRARCGGQTVGLATAHLLTAPPAVFLIYLAAARGLRGRGVGGALFAHAWRAGAQSLAARGLRAAGMIWEVDSPGAAGGEEESRRRERRIAFFARHGGELLPRPYLQPPVDGVAPVPMSLMFRPAEGLDTPPPPVIDALVRAMYFEKYGAANGIPADVLERLLAAGATPPARPPAA